jgi:hypothetical protein
MAQTDSTLSMRLFIKGLVAELSTRGITDIKPHSPNTLDGFRKIINALESEIKKLSKSKDLDAVERYNQLIYLRNELNPSLTGAFDGLEHNLLSLQNSYIKCPNPHYDKIFINISPVLAKAFLLQAEKCNLDLIQKATNAYLSAF